MLSKGFQNEFDFVLLFNRKKVKELDPVSYELIRTLFGNISNDLEIKSWRNHYKQKTDIFLKIGNVMKGISIKMGSRNSVHVEHISDFIRFLEYHNIPESIINKYLLYHYADGTNDNTGKNRLGTLEYKRQYQNDIDEINVCFNSEKMIIDSIIRFVLKGNNSRFCIDAIIVGVPNDYMWITRKDIVDVLMKKSNEYVSSPHFSSLVCQPLSRCLNYNYKYEDDRNFVQIKWYSLFDDIIRKKSNYWDFQDNNVG